MNIGYYVRLNNGVYGVVVINRIAEIYEDTILTENDGSMYQGEYAKEEIIKSSPNIIDLIEEGDYVNGKLVSYIGSNCIEVYWYKDEMEWLEQEDIISIVTKEQFLQMEYKVGEKN